MMAGETEREMRGCRFAIGRMARPAGRLALVSAVWLWLGSAAAVAATAQEQGYIPMADGVQLAYTVELPASTGRFPVALVYDGYCEGAGPLTCNDPQSASALLAAGY